VTRLGRDRGSVSIMFAIGSTAVLMFIGLALDGGGQIRNTELANNLAAEAARVGGQMINIPQAISGDTPVIDTVPADCTATYGTRTALCPYQVAAYQYLDTAAAEANVTISSDSAALTTTGGVTVTVTLACDSAMLNFFGWHGTLAATGTASVALETTA
jgi:Putative Flp pilus-assembly TadE/G-like